MSNYRTVTTIGAVAALFLTAESVKASAIGLPMDIKPGSCPNSFKIDGPSRGVLPVAILGTDDFDVQNVDVSSLVIFRADEAHIPERRGFSASGSARPRFQGQGRGHPVHRACLRLS